MGPAGRALPVLEAILPDGPNLNDYYSDRSVTADETVRRMWPSLSEFGITRVARQTGLDYVGIPTWAAFRPNSRSLAGSQGKGITDAAACVSAIMEAVEVAVAENPAGVVTKTSAASLNEAWYDPERFLPFGRKLDRAAELSWISGRDLVTGRPIWIPLDLVDMDGERCDLAGVCKGSNGLASGNTPEEAMFHGLCELIERDGTSLWSLLSDEAAIGTAFDAAALADPVVDYLCGKIAKAGLRLRLLDQTSDLGIPVVMAVIGPDRAGGAMELDVTAGYGAHPVAARAAIRAITEAAQSRVTAIAASRDDIAKTSFQRAADDINLALLRAEPHGAVPQGVSGRASLPELLGVLQAALADNNCTAVAASIAPRELPISVVKVISPDLEDRGANLNWRPGWRCFDALEAA